MLSFNITSLVCVVINLLILYLLFRFILYKRVMGVIEKRQELINKQISDAKDTNTQAQNLKAQYEEQLGGAKEESLRIVAEAKQRGEATYARMVKDAEAETADMMKKAQAQIDAQREKTRQEAQAEISGLAMAAAAKILSEASGQTTDSAMYDAFLKSQGAE